MGFGTRFWVVACLWLGTALSVNGEGEATIRIQHVTREHSSVNPSISLNSLKAATDHDYDPIEEHESNGPEGAGGVPMQRLSLIGVVSIVGLLLTSGALAKVTRNKRATGN